MNASPPRTNFDALRLLAVGIVIYGNGLVLTSQPPSALWGAPMPRIGLDLLFAISGFLATQSWLRSRRILPYAAARALRLFPALVACVIVTIVAIGPLATRLGLRTYVRESMTRQYLLNIVLDLQLWLPRVFEHQQWVGTVNPMLWTLAPGLLGALSIPAFGRLPPRARLPAAALCAVLCALLSWFWPNILPRLPQALHRSIIPDTLVEAPFFLVGAALAFADHHLGDRLWRADLAMLAFGCNWIMATWLGDWTLALEWISLPYMALTFGRMSMPALGRFGRLGNPSYGAYLYAFPLQQLVVERLPGAAYPILACFLLTVLAGYLSWHLVERPALLWAAPLWRHATARLARAAP